jgi:hypothetical protein|tara:strand:+ start:231 stop:626 length:396 start_codon:yes stop_codon:yes gene_type:complete
MDNGYIPVGKVYPSKNQERNDFVIKFPRVVWGLINNDKYYKKLGQRNEKGKPVPKFSIFRSGNKIGIAIPMVAKYGEKKPYLHIIKYRDKYKHGIAGNDRQYFIFDIDKDFNPKLNASVRYKAYDKTSYFN